MENPEITIKDIAKALGISFSTVSRALNGSRSISKETIRRVQDYAKEHRYIPNAMARSLKQNRRSKIIGVIVPELANLFFSSVLSGIESVAELHDYHVIVCQSSEEYEKEIRNVQTLINARVCGVLVSMSKNTKRFEHFKELVNHNIPIVFFDRICPEIDASKVVVNDYNGAFDATEYMINTGCKRIAFFHAPMNLEITKNRYNGYIDALAKHKLPIDNKIICLADTKALGYECSLKLLNRENRPDGFMTMNDYTAAGVLLACKSLKLNVPNDVSIFGFSNSTISQDTDPMISTVDQRPQNIGEAAMNLMIEKIEKRENISAKNKIIKTEIVLRETTK